MAELWTWIMTNIIGPILLIFGKEVVAETTAAVKASTSEKTKVAGQDAAASTAASTYQSVMDDPTKTEADREKATTSFLNS